MKKWIPYPRYIFRKVLALNLIKKYIPKNSKFLEIGCATGYFGITLSKLGYYGKMIDFSEEAASAVTKNLKTYNITNVYFEQKDIFDFGDREHFDFIIIFEVLEHIKNDKGVLNKLNSLLKQNGFLLLSVPAKEKLWGASDELVGHIRRYNKNDLEKLLNDTGFRILRFYSYGYPFLNIIKIFRDYCADKKLKIKKNKTKIQLSQESGLNIIRIPFIKYIFNKYTLFPFIQFSRVFNNFDLAEGYLCLTKKII